MSVINFAASSFFTSKKSYDEKPLLLVPEIVFLGRSNVGKSTLINRLLGQKLAFSSKKAGKTQLLNYFLVDNSFFLVDTPGYGYTAYGHREDESFATMMDNYFLNPRLKGAFLLLDGRRSLNADDLLLLDFLKKQEVAVSLIVTKADQCKQKDLARLKKELAQYFSEFYLSSPSTNIKELRSLIARILNK